MTEKTTYHYSWEGILESKVVERNYKDEIEKTTVQVAKVLDGAKIPTEGSDESAGYDLYACKESNDGSPVIASILPGCSAKIHTGISMSIPRGFFGAVYARSGLASKKGLRPANCVGVIDSDYRGEIMVVLYNDSDRTQIVAPGDRIAQIIISPYAVDTEMEEVDILDETERGEGGFGSTGV